MDFATVYTHAVEYQLKLQQCTRILLDAFAHTLITTLSTTYGLDSEKVAAHSKPILDAFISDPDDHMPVCKAVTYRGKPCHKRAAPDNGYCDLHQTKKVKQQQHHGSKRPADTSFARVTKLLRTL